MFDGLDVAMNDSFLMSVLNRLANLNEQFEPLARGKFLLVAVIGDFHPADQFHDKVRAARFRRAGVKHLRDVRMVHQRQCLTLGFKARDHRFGIHAEFDDL